MNRESLFSACEAVKGGFLTTYEQSDEVKRMARKHCFQMRIIPMKNTDHATMGELVIGKDLTWMDTYPSAHEPLPDYVATFKK